MRLTAVLILCLVFCHWAKAEPLTEEHIRRARRIVLIPGSFDPFHLGHQGVGESILRADEGDLVIYVPEVSSPAKDTYVVDLRLQLLHAAMGSHSQMTYPLGGSIGEEYVDGGNYLGLLEKIQKMNPSASITHVIGEDVVRAEVIQAYARQVPGSDFIIAGREPDVAERLSELRSNLEREKIKIRFIQPTPVGVSSTAVRSFFSENQHLFSQNEWNADQLPNHLLHPDVARFILRNRIYVDRPDNRWGRLGRVMRLESWLMSRLRVREYLANDWRARIRIEPRTHVEIDGKIYPVIRELGHGFQAVAYLIDWNGQPAVAKIAYDQPVARDTMTRSARVSEVLDEAGSPIRRPRLFFSSRDGTASVSEFIEGRTLMDYLAGGGAVTSKLERELRGLHNSAVELLLQTGHQLDLGATNIMVHGEELFLVDLGPIDFSQHPGLARTYQEWMESIRRETQKPNFAKECLVRAVRNSSFMLHFLVQKARQVRAVVR